jgi:hypothetical protein
LSTNTCTISNLEFGYFVTNTSDFSNNFVTNNTRVVARPTKIKGKKEVRIYATFYRSSIFKTPTVNLPPARVKGVYVRTANT